MSLSISEVAWAIQVRQKADAHGLNVEELLSGELFEHYDRIMSGHEQGDLQMSDETETPAGDVHTVADDLRGVTTRLEEATRNFEYFMQDRYPTERRHKHAEAMAVWARRSAGMGVFDEERPAKVLLSEADNTRYVRQSWREYGPLVPVGLIICGLVLAFVAVVVLFDVSAFAVGFVAPLGVVALLATGFLCGIRFHGRDEA